MGKIIRITSADGFEFDGYLAEPDGKPRGAIMVIQEIFGVNQHIREVTDGYAQSGYVALAPAIFDRAEANVELAYDQNGIMRGAEIARGKLNMPDTLKDLSASVQVLSGSGKVGAVGYCFGGMLAYLCASQVAGLSCSIGYYGGGIVGALDQQPTIPVILHFGELDAHIPMSDVEKIRAGCPDIPVYTYAADHGFNCDHRASYNAEAAGQALERSLTFFEQHLSG